MTDRDVDMINVEMMRVNEPSFEGITPDANIGDGNVTVQVYGATTHDHISK